MRRPQGLVGSSPTPSEYIQIPMHEVVLTNYNIGEVDSISKIPTGLINETYKINASNGVFILQRLNPIFAAESIYDVDAVSQYLKNQGMLVQEIIRTREGKLWVEEKGEIWRLMTYVPGSVYERIENPQMAYAAGKILGQFHHALTNFKYEFRHHRTMHHATEKHFELFLKATERQETRSQKQETMNKNELQKLTKIVLQLPKLLLPTSLRKTITHGDPKVSNIIFGVDDQNLALKFDRNEMSNKKAIALIDLDDVGNQHSPLIELGDAFRSWCGGYEDDPNNTFDLKKFQAALSGYNEGAKNFLTNEERKLIPQAIKLITLELASRFLRDYFEDSYFGWNQKKYKSRRQHNLARTKGQVALYNDIVRKGYV